MSNILVIEDVPAVLLSLRIILTGLGLPVVFGLMQEMSGSITLASEPGTGTTVTLRIPFAAEPDA